MRKALQDLMRKRRSPGRSIGPAGASTVSKDGKRMKTTKRPTAKQRQLEKLKDMRNRVMGTQKVMVAKVGGAALIADKRKQKTKQFLAEARKKQKNKTAKPKGKGIFGAAAKLPGTMAASGIKAVGRKFKSAAEKMRLQKARKAGLSRALSKLGGKGAGAAARAFQKAKQRKPGGRLTADDLKRATRSR